MKDSYNERHGKIKAVVLLFTPASTRWHDPLRREECKAGASPHPSKRPTWIPAPATAEERESIHPRACSELNSATARETNVTRPVLVFSLQLPQKLGINSLQTARASVSRWLPYLSRTGRATPHASSDEGLSHWSPHDTPRFPQSPIPVTFFLVFSPLASERCDMTSCIPGPYIFMARSRKRRGTVEQHALECTAYNQSDSMHIAVLLPWGDSECEQARESWSDLMLLTDQTDSRRNRKFPQPSEHLRPRCLELKLYHTK